MKTYENLTTYNPGEIEGNGILIGKSRILSRRSRHE